MHRFLMALTTAALVSSVNSADAALILTGSMGFDVTSIQPSTGSLLGVQSLTFALSTNQTATNDFSPYVGQPAINFGTVTLNLANAIPIAFSDPGFGTFSGSSFVRILDSETDSIIRITGMFTPGPVGSSLISGFDPGLVDFKISFNQGGNGTVGSAILFSPSGTQGERPTNTGITNPEPTSIAMFGTMCVPLALGWYRRRQKAAQAAL